MKEKISWFNEIPAKVFLVFSIIGIYYFYFGNFVLFKMESKYEKIAYIVFIFSVVITIVNGIQLFYASIKKYFVEKDNKKYYKDVVANFDDYERVVLCRFYDQNRSTLSLEFSDPIIQGLVDKNVLVNTNNLAGGFFIDGLNCTYKINSYVRSIIDPEKNLKLNEYRELKQKNRRF